MVATGIWQRFALLGVLNRRFVSDFASVFSMFPHPPGYAGHHVWALCDHRRSDQDRQLFQS